MKETYYSYHRDTIEAGILRWCRQLTVEAYFQPLVT